MATITPYKRELPFIHRAWKTAVDHLSPYGMGIKLSSTNGDNVVNGDQTIHVAKRRRIADDSPESAPRGALGHLLSDNPIDYEKALRVEVLQITHSDSSGSIPNGLPNDNGPSKKDIPLIKARCKLIICKWRPGMEARVLYCDSQFCNFKVSRDADDVCRRARIYLTSPFYVPAEKLCVERDDDDGFDLADQYMVIAELGSAGDPKWPPLDLLPKRETLDIFSGLPQHVVLSTQIVYQFEKGRVSNNVLFRRKTGEDTKLELMMEMDLRWSTGHTAASTPAAGEVSTPPDIKMPHVNGALEPLTNGYVNGRAEQLVNGHQREEYDPMVEDDDDHEEATTPSRSLRAREKQNYNLKLLSDKARGRERKRRKQQRKSATVESEAGRVTWILPRAGPVILKDYHCIRCYAAHTSLAQLAKHMEAHEEFKYSFDWNSSRIWITPHDQETPRISRSSLLDLSSSGGREGKLEESVSLENIHGDMVQDRSLEPCVPAKPKDMRQLIPNIKQPIYDRLSKAQVEPGSLIDPPQVDDTWLVQKHRDIIRDYSDVHADEKEYMYEWDALVNMECVTSEPHLQDVYLQFVQDKASWLVASQSRMTEWSKHLSYLKARNALTEPTIDKAFAILRVARSQKRPDQPEPPKPISPRNEYRKSVSGCAVCGQPVRGPSTLVCSDLNCDRALYHRDCIRNKAKQSIDSRNWHCNECLREQQTVAK
ncbi:hypothetical protein F5X99DRAFT_364076 [Biscogniauxia marginata]|nr:hypothetical protein F5X99DRAFT_364076 [Biscogniauxia marginata]